MKIIGFYKPDEENGYLSNWYPSSFTVEGIEYSSMEQYMMYQKALCFDDKDTAEQILKIDDASKIKALGREVSNYNNHIWNGMRQIIVYEGLKAKFIQNPQLKKQLKSTKSAILAECTVRDLIWGIGVSIKDPERFNQSKWKGQNLLGYALMAVRDKI